MKRSSMDLKAYYFDVEVKGVALVYAESAEQAQEQLACAKVMCAGNKMRRFEIDIIKYNAREEI